MPPLPTFDEVHLQKICDVLGATEPGLTGAEIGGLLRQLGIADPSPERTKRHRLYEALKARQHQDHCGNLVVAFIQAAMAPVRYTGQQEAFDQRRYELNEVLAFSGYQVGEDGTVGRVDVARTLGAAEELAGRLRAELRRRMVHPDVLSFCRAELLQQNYFHAVLEATKSLADKIRAKSGLSGDGGELAAEAFSIGKAGMPFLAFNSLQTETEKKEQSGLMNLMIGMFGAFRNVTAHAPKPKWILTEQDALDLLTIASLLHRRVDAAIRTPRVR